MHEYGRSLTSIPETYAGIYQAPNQGPLTDKTPLNKSEASESGHAILTMERLRQLKCKSQGPTENSPIH